MRMDGLDSRPPTKVEQGDKLDVPKVHQKEEKSNSDQ